MQTYEVFLFVDAVVQMCVCGMKYQILRHANVLANYCSYSSDFCFFFLVVAGWLGKESGILFVLLKSL